MITTSQNQAADVGRQNLRRYGFTLIEMMVVVFIIGVLCTMAIPRINIPQFQVDAAARLTRLTLQGAQRLAVARQYDVVVSIDQANNRLRVLEDANNNDAVDANERVTYKSLEDGISFHLPPTGVNGSVGNRWSAPTLRPLMGCRAWCFVVTARRRAISSSTS